MFEARRPQSTLSLAFNMAILVFNTAARNVRQGHGNALVSILLSVVQSLFFLAAFYIMFSVLGLRGAVLRGDFMLYLLSGIFAFLTHIQTLGAVSGAGGSTSGMMQHAPMNTYVSIFSVALSTLYVKSISLIIILAIVHTMSAPLEFYYWPGALMMFLLAWASGAAVGVVLLALTPWRPELIAMIKLVYMRANMIASGKMFVANTLPSFMVAYFDWNPLFHVIDQARGYTFKNYFPHHSNWEYAVYVTLVLFMIGFMGEFYTRKHESASWGAKQ